MKIFFCKNRIFFIPKRYFFIPSKIISYPQKKIYFHTSKTFFILLYKNFIPCENLFCFMLCFHFIPSTSISYPDHGISYQVAKFSYPQQPISYSFHFPLMSLPDSLYVHIHLQLKELGRPWQLCLVWRRRAGRLQGQRAGHSVWRRGGCSSCTDCGSAGGHYD